MLIVSDSRDRFQISCILRVVSCDKDVARQDDGNFVVTKVMPSECLAFLTPLCVLAHEVAGQCPN